MPAIDGSLNTLGLDYIDLMPQRLNGSHAGQEYAGIWLCIAEAH